MTGKMWLEQRILWRWGSAGLSWLSASPWVSCSTPATSKSPLAKGLAGHIRTKLMKRLICIRGVCLVDYIREWIGPSPAFFPLFSFSSSFLSFTFFVSRLLLWTIHMAGPAWDLRAADILCLLRKTYFISYHILPLTPYWTWLWELGDYGGVLCLGSQNGESWSVLYEVKGLFASTLGEIYCTNLRAC